MSAVGVRPMVPSDLPLVLDWRNHPDVRRYMYTTHEISVEEHRQWFERASQDPNRRMLICEDGITALGFISFHVITSGGVANWGFYAAPGAPSGTGRSLGAAALRYAFVDLRVHKLCGQAIACNSRSIRLHRALGFQLEGTLREQHFDGRIYHDVMCFGLLCYKWRADQHNLVSPA